MFLEISSELRKIERNDKRSHISQFKLVEYVGLKALALKTLCPRIPLVGRWEKVGRQMLMYMSTRFRLWSPNGWSDRDG